jgi:methanogenic corrinoid protein MtbC1
MENDREVDPKYGAQQWETQSAWPVLMMPRPEVYARPDLEKRNAILASVISEEILPRLLQHHHLRREPEPPLALPSSEEIAEFGKLAIGPDIEAATCFFRRMQAKGHSLDTLFVHLLEPTARHLGDLWTQDKCDFIDVTVGVARLQELLHFFGAAIEVAFEDMHHHAMLFSMAGETHLFGVDMVAKFLRGAGWTVTSGSQADPACCAELVAAEKIGVVGLTLSSLEHVDAGARIIAAVRKASRNPYIGIMVGGNIFRDNRDLALQIGADATAPDAPSAVILAKKLLLTATLKG